jgi:hypothetical protein
MLAATKAEVCAIVNTLHISGFGVNQDLSGTVAHLFMQESVYAL